MVPIDRTYPTLNDTGQASIALRNCTTVAWAVSTTSASQVGYLLGVHAGAIVSAYRVTHPASDWPVIPDGALGERRRCVPVRDVTSAEWVAALASRPPAFFGGVRYAEAILGPSGELTGIRSWDVPTEREETVDDAVL